MFSKVFKANPYHDKMGRFSTRAMASSSLEAASFRESLGLPGNNVRMSKLGFKVREDLFDNGAFHEEGVSLGKIKLPSIVTQSEATKDFTQSILGRTPDPIKVREVGGEYVVLDGHHRLAAAKASGAKRIDAVLVGSKKNASLHSKAAQSHYAVGKPAKKSDGWVGDLGLGAFKK